MVKFANGELVAQNRRARFDYTIEDTLEAGIQLTGSEVKSLRNGGASIAESYAGESGGEIWLINAHIAELTSAKHFNHAPRRQRKLLLRRREIERLLGDVKRQGITIVPLRMYFNDRGLVKLQLGIARGKRKVDKRQTAKDRDWGRQKQRLLREKN